MTTLDALIAALTRTPTDPALRMALTDHLIAFPGDIGRLVDWIGDGVQTAWERFESKVGVQGGEFSVYYGDSETLFHSLLSSDGKGAVLPAYIGWAAAPFWVRPTTVRTILAA